MTGGWHIHSGFSCDDAGGHYFEGLDVDPWCSSCTTWASDSTGVAYVTWSSSDFSLTGVRPVSGRTFVVHDKDGKKAACGVIEPSTMQVTSLGAYPGYMGGRMVRGLVGIADRSDGVQIEGLITGLEPGVTGGWHIHSGYSCSETPAGLTAGAVGGHYYDGLTADPWTLANTNYNSDGSGVARISKTMPDFSLYGERPVYGRTVVVHESNSAVKPACGVIGVGASSYEALMPSMVKYVGYAGGQTVNGMLKFSSNSPLTISGVLTGLEPSTSGGWHVHSGFSCTDAAGAGGHYYDGLGSDPWCSDCVKWHSDAKGVAVVSLTMDDFTLDPAGPRYVGGRTVVVHASGGTKVACGVIEPLAGAEVVTLGRYPGFGGADTVRGMMLEKQVGSSSVHFKGMLTGLEPSVTGGWHVHTGYSCASGSAVGGHYFDGLKTDPWTADNTNYQSDARGVAVIDKLMPDFSLYDGARAVYGRDLVVHQQQASVKSGCGYLPMGEVVLPPPPSPPAPPPPLIGASAAVRIGALPATTNLALGSPQRAEFERQFKADVAAAVGGGVTAEQVVISELPTAITEEGVMVEFTILEVAGRETTAEDAMSALVDKLREGDLSLANGTVDLIAAPPSAPPPGGGDGEDGTPIWVWIVVAVVVVLVLCCVCLIICYCCGKSRGGGASRPKGAQKYQNALTATKQSELAANQA